MKKELEREYIVEKILEKKQFKNEYKYKVKWLGYPESKSTWEPIAHLSKCLDLIEEYEKNQNKISEKTKCKTEDKKLIGKKRRNLSDEDIEEEDKSSVKQLKDKKEIEDSASVDNFQKSISIKQSIKDKLSKGKDQPNTIKSVTSSSSEQITKEFSLKSPDRLKHIETVNKEFKESEIISSPKILTRTKVRKSEDDKIIENVFEKLKSPTNNRKESDNIEKNAPKVLKREGDLEYDTPIAIIDAKQHRDINDEILCFVEWRVRRDGTKPENSYYTNKELKMKFPMLLCEFYESRLKFPNKNKF